MHDNVESRAWRRGFLAGFLVLALSSGAQVAVSRTGRTCSIREEPGLAERLIQHVKPAVRAHGGVAQRVALAVLGAMLHSSCA